MPIDNTLQFDGSGNLGVEISTVIDLLDEDIRYYSTDTTREDARQASKGVVFLDTSRYPKRIHSVEWDFEGDGVGHNYTTFLRTHRHRRRHRLHLWRERDAFQRHDFGHSPVQFRFQRLADTW